MAEHHPVIRIDRADQQDVPILVADGVLDGSTYRSVRDIVIKAALDEPLAVIVDVDRLCVPSSSAWSVFTSVRWHVSIWPDVPILLVCTEPPRRRAIFARGVGRHVPVHTTRESALSAVRCRSAQLRRRARTELPRSRGSLNAARGVVTDWLTEWEIRDMIPIAATVATVLIENVLDHTESAAVLIVESYLGEITIAVEDDSARLPSRHEDSHRGADVVSGLAIVSALSKAWGATPTSSGKTVWAVVSSENRF